VQEGKVLIESVLAGRRRPPQSVTDLFLGLLFVLENGLYVTRHIHVCGRQGEEVQETMRRRWRRRGQLWVDEVLATLCQKKNGGEKKIITISFLRQNPKVFSQRVTRPKDYHALSDVCSHILQTCV
jgi:hypothetical protein